MNSKHLKQQYQGVVCSGDCIKCIWWNCPYLPYKHNPFHSRYSILRDVFVDDDTKYLLCYCQKCGRYWIKKKDGSIADLSGKGEK